MLQKPFWTSYTASIHRMGELLNTIEKKNASFKSQLSLFPLSKLLQNLVNTATEYENESIFLEKTQFQ